MEGKNRNWTNWLFCFSIATAVVAIYKLLDNFNEITYVIKNFFSIISPFLAGILIAYILYIPCSKIEKTYKKNKILKRRARPLSVATVYLITLIIIIILVNVILPPVIQSVVDLTNNFQNYYNIAINKINELPEDSILKSEISKNILDEIQNFDLKEIINVETITQYLQKVVGMLGGVFDIFVSIVVSIYILNSRSQIIRFLKRLAGAIFNTKSYENINKYFNRTNEIFFKFLASQMIDAVVVGVLTSIAMTIMGVKYSVLLGFMIGLFNIIPYFGAIVAVIIAGMLTFFTGGIGQTILMLVVVTILQQIDANIINPKIVGDSLKISPLLVIFAVTLGGAYFGVLGMFLAVPVIAVIKLIIDDFIDLKNNIKEK
jgi:predicted PurR-regulated permease PerM